LSSHGVRIDTARDRKLVDCVAHPRWLISLSTIWNRREVGRVGLCKNSVIGNEPEERIVIPFLECDDPGKRHIPPHFDRRLRELMRAGVTVEHADDTGTSRFGDHRSRVILCIPRVHDYGPAQLASECQLRGKRATLFLPRRIVVMVVETALSDRHRATSDESLELSDVVSRMESVSVMRMYTRSAPYISRILSRDDRRCASGAEDIPGAASRADADYSLGSAFLRALNYRVAVAGERLVCEVRVGVDEPLDIPIFLGHFLSIQRRVGPAM